jgi:flagellar biosynthesis protein FlhG
VVAVSGGKGGVGKSSLALNIGVAMAGAGRKVLLVDADLGLASLDVLLGLQPECSLAEVALDDRPLSDALVRIMPGLDLLPGASGVSAMADLGPVPVGQLLAGLSRMDSAYELVIVDTAAGAGEQVRAFLRAADRVAVVTTPEPTSITDAYALAKILTGERQSRLGLIVNMARSDREACRVADRLVEVARSYFDGRIEKLGTVPYDWQVGAAVRERRPLVSCRPVAPAAVAIRRLAGSLWRWAQPQGFGVLPIRPPADGLPVVAVAAGKE